MVDGTTPKPPPLDITNLVAWIKKDSQTLHLLCQDVEEKIFKYIMKYRTSEIICNKLKEVHDQWSHESIHHIQQWIFDITMEEGESNASFLGNFEEAKSELTNLGNNTHWWHCHGQGLELVANMLWKHFSHIGKKNCVEETISTMVGQLIIEKAEMLKIKQPTWQKNHNIHCHFLIQEWYAI